MAGTSSLLWRDASGEAPGKLAKASRSNLNAFVQEQLCRSIVLGRYSPGERLNIRQLAEDLGTSVTPVREALMRLSASGVLESEPGQFRLPRLTRDLYAEICEIRVANERMAATHATTNATAQELKTIETEAAAYIAAIQARDFRTAVEQYSTFKLALYGASRMPVLQSIIENLMLRAAPFFAYSLTSASSEAAERAWFDNNIKLIKQITTGLKRRNADQVCDAVEGIIRNATERVLNHQDA